MKKLLSIMAALIAVSAMCAQELKLPAPDRTRGMSVMKAFAKRHSVRVYSDRQLSVNDLSDLLWAAMGQNRDNGNLTAPSCQNKQEIRLFVFSDKGVAEYIPATHSLKPLAKGDHRGLVAGRQDFVKTAPVSLVMVADMNKFGSTDDRAMMMVSVDAGIVSENVSIAATGLGMATVPRASMDVDGIRNLLGLDETQIPIINNPVGYIK